MTASARRYRAPKRGRQKNWPKRRAPIARLRGASRTTPKRPGGGLTNARERASRIAGLIDLSTGIWEQPWISLT
jgi:hypothetical protein